MAIKAGRVGVNPASVDELGNITSGGLTPEERAKLDKALVTPVSAPTEKELVGVGTGNEQIMVKVGDGLTLSGETSPFSLDVDGGMKYSTLEASTTTLSTTSPVTLLHDAIVCFYNGKTVYAGLNVNGTAVNIPASQTGVVILKKGDAVLISHTEIKAVVTYLNRT